MSSISNDHTSVIWKMHLCEICGRKVTMVSKGQTYQIIRVSMANSTQGSNVANIITVPLTHQLKWSVAHLQVGRWEGGVEAETFIEWLWKPLAQLHVII